MIDFLVLFTRGGYILWSRCVTKLSGDPVSHIINNVFLLDQHPENNTVHYKNYAMSFEMDNQREIILLAVYTHLSPLFDIRGFLLKVKNMVCAMYPLLEDLDKEYDQVLQSYEAMLRAGLPEEAEGSQLTKNVQKVEKTKEAEEIGEETEKENVNEREETQDDTNVPEEIDILAKLKLHGVRSRKGKKQGGFKGATKTKKKPKAKEARKWDQPSFVNFSDNTPLSSEGHEAKVEERVELVEYDSDYEVEDPEEENGKEEKSSGVLSYFSGLVRGRELVEADLVDVMEKMGKDLMGKNVAMEISEQICTSVRKSLVGQKLSTFQTVRATVRKAMEDALVRILTPKRKIEILRDIRSVVKREKRPYSVVFVGVNGVGKSTSLAKICYYLRTKGLKVSFAACDTFRAGAVEQLKTHAQRLGVEVYDRGYNKDSSAVASDALRVAKTNGDDVVLIDTAGRMQDNEPLMRSLSKLILVNKPDLV